MKSTMIQISDNHFVKREGLSSTIEEIYLLNNDLIIVFSNIQEPVKIENETTIKQIVNHLFKVLEFEVYNPYSKIMDLLFDENGHRTWNWVEIK